MQEKNHSWAAILAWSAAVSFYFYQFLLQVIPSVLKPEIQETFQVSSQQFGSMAAYFLYAYAAMQIPAGLLLDRYGPRAVLPIATMLCASGAGLFGIADTYQLAAIARILTGIGSAFAVIGCFKVAAMQFDARHFSFMTGLTVMIGMSGAAFGQGLVGPIVHSITHWQDVFYVFLFSGFVLACAMWLFIPNRAARHDLAEFKSFQQLGSELAQVLSNPITWVAALYAGLMYVPTLALGEAWGIAFLEEGYHLPRIVAHQVVPSLFIGWALGSFLFGFLSEFFSRASLMISSSFLVWGICVFLVQLDRSAFGGTEWAILFFALGICSAGFILAFTSAKEANPEEMAATSSGVMNTMNTLCGALTQQAIGALLDHRLSLTGHSMPSIDDYRYALSLVVYAAFASAILSLVLAIVEKTPKRS